MDNQLMQVQVEIALIENMSKEVIGETARLEKFTDRILAKLSSVITLSGILTFLSFAFISNDQSLLTKFYLTWAFPHLLLAMALWVLTLRKSAAIIAKQIPFIESSDPQVTLQYLKLRLEMHNGVHAATNDIYQGTRKIFSYSLSFIATYLITYILIFYLFVFANLPSILNMVLITIIILLLAQFFRIWYTSTKTAVSVTGDIQIKPNTPQKAQKPQSSPTPSK